MTSSPCWGGSWRPKVGMLKGGRTRTVPSGKSDVDLSEWSDKAAAADLVLRYIASSNEVAHESSTVVSSRGLCNNCRRQHWPDDSDGCFRPIAGALRIDLSHLPP